MDESVLSTRCIDGHLDWDTASGHYDARVVRTCQRGHIHFTDPSGDFWYDEPSNWDGRNVTGIQRGAGYKIDDSSLEVMGEDMVWGSSFSLYNTAPRTTAGIDMWAKLWTHYQDGHEVIKNANPHNCAQVATHPDCP
jgi:hypothetical protein